MNEATSIISGMIIGFTAASLTGWYQLTMLGVGVSIASFIYYWKGKV